MPVYGYRCSRGHHFEVQQRITEEPLTQCPECGAPVTRVFYPVGIVFKGSGFYKTDSRGASSHGSAPSTETAKPESKTDSKAAKTENKSTPKEGAA
ncbi:MAG TPA: FmdB family zinc ribbon protein [Candidatus Dormibacteraeota bacterium]|nr:FmdB family zinc ribbon protein [Candidatus Dormibacteraeota bacterium]